MNSVHLPEAISAALDLRSNEGLSFAELSARTGIPAGQLAAARYGLPSSPRLAAFVELAVAGTDVVDTDAVILRGPLGHEVEAPAGTSPEALTKLASALPC